MFYVQSWVYLNKVGYSSGKKKSEAKVMNTSTGDVFAEKCSVSQFPSGKKQRAVHPTARLLVEDLPNGSMHDEHGKGQGAKGGHRFGSEKLGDARGLFRQSVAVHGFQELPEMRK